MTPAFLLVDLLQDFFRQPPLSERRAAIAESVNSLTRFARRMSIPIFWIRQEFQPDLNDAFLSMRETGTRITIAGTAGAGLIRELEVLPGDHEIVKKRYSAFFRTNLDQLLSSFGCTHVIVAGVNTHACVRSSAIDAFQLDYHVILASDAISSYDDEYHRESMRYLAQSVGEVLTNAQIKEKLRPPGRGSSG